MKNFEGESALHLAAKNGQLPVVQSLVKKYGLDAWEEDARGRDAVEILTENGFVREAETLAAWRNGRK